MAQDSGEPSANRPKDSRVNVRLVALSGDMREALLDYAESFRRAGEPYWQEELAEMRADFEAFCRRRRGQPSQEDRPPDRVPQADYFLVNRRGKIVGSIRLRHRLTEELRDAGGHVGYDVRPSQRGRGHASRMVRAVLAEARKLGLRRVLLTCEKRNKASARVIGKCGGALESESYSEQVGHVMQRYWIEL